MKKKTIVIMFLILLGNVAIITAESETTVLIGTLDHSYRIRGIV